MRRREVLLAWVLLGLSRARVARAGPEASLDVDARWLAGMAAPSATPGEGWWSYAADEDSRWRRAAPRFQAMEDWARRELSPVLPAARPVFYPFGGPDAVHAIALFGGAPHLLLVGLEPIGDLPDPGAMEGADSAAYFAALGAAMADLHRLTFFRTRALASDVRQIGVLPILLASIVRLGGHVVSVARPAPFRASIAWTSREGRESRLDYAQIDLGNGSLGRHPEHVAALRDLGSSVTFMKAASYLLGDARFSFARRLILEVSDAIVQDDSGVPFSDLHDGWTTRLFGRYVAPLEPFQDRAQPDLASAFAAQRPPPLPFGIGYHALSRRSNLVVALRASR